MPLRYRRVLLKLGGEALAGPEGSGIDTHRAEEIATRIRELKETGVEIVLVLGAGTLWRGS